MPVSISNPSIRRVRSVPLAVFVVAPLVLHLPAEGQSKPVPEGQVLKMEQLTKQRFKALPDEQVVEVKGRRVTVKELRAEAELGRERDLAQISARVAQEGGKFEARRAHLLKERKAALEAENTKVRAELAQMSRRTVSPQLTRQEIGEEARRLYAGSKNAAPAEMAEIEERAGELLRQLERLRQ